MMNHKISDLELFFHYSKITIKAWFQYRLDACLRSLAVFLREGAGIAIVYLMLLKFDTINGWNVQELLFLFSFIFLTYGIFIIFFTGFRDFEKMVNSGTFDRLLLRPRGLVFQVIASNSDWFAALGHGGLGVVLFIYSAGQLDVTWTALSVFYCVAAIAGGVLIQGALFLFLASMSFFLIKTGNLRSVFYWSTRRFAGYPISLFHNTIQMLLIYIVPFAFVNYFPAQYILRKSDMADFPALYMYIAPFVGVVLYIGAYLFWRFSVKHYKSSGN